MVVLAVLVGVASVCAAQDQPDEQEGASACECARERETLTGDWFGARSALEERGIAWAFSLTSVHQVNTRGGLSTHDRESDWSGIYDVELELDFEALCGLPGGSMYTLVEGGWNDSIDGSSVGSATEVNDNASGDLPVDLLEFWWEQSLFDGRVRLRFGKIDLTGGFECRGCPVGFDGSAFANDAVTQFLASALANNPTIPFPDNGLGLALHVEPLEGVYMTFGMADAQADGGSHGLTSTLETGLHHEDYMVHLLEIGATPRLESPFGPVQGAYRIGLWLETGPKDFFDGTDTKRDDVGFYLSFDQLLLKENEDPEDAQGLGLFLRYGIADENVNDISRFWSMGAQYQGLIPTRDDDVLAFAAALSRMSRDAGYTAEQETVMELYYNAQITPWAAVAPSIQFINNPGGDNQVKRAVVLGMRIAVDF